MRWMSGPTVTALPWAGSKSVSNSSDAMAVRALPVRSPKDLSS